MFLGDRAMPDAVERYSGDEEGELGEHAETSTARAPSGMASRRTNTVPHLLPVRESHLDNGRPQMKNIGRPMSAKATSVPADLRQRWNAPSRPRPIVFLGAGGIVNDAHLPAYRRGGLSVAVDCVGKRIRCNAVGPGTVQTPSLDERIAAPGDPVKTRAAFVASQQIGRLGSAEEIAALVVHLASDESGYTTGAIHVIDGGWSA